ncbi:hypothetical protein PV327_002484 [Microctonus hyperodae]|uniref:Uncharacterized protein n=1 Tax=Microctonus hyperodae TaxID=165561 RepID=A0AA39FFS9_MICHY|nr:hypothetical protein PV327_002484 [Microctonus hyperodae]
MNTPCVDTHRYNTQDSESARLIYSKMRYNSKDNRANDTCIKPSMFTYKTFDSTIANSHQCAISKRYIPDSAASDSSGSFEHYSTHSAANSHEVYRILSEKSDKIYSTSDIISPSDNTSNYEIANSHINYPFIYDCIDDSDENIDGAISPLITTISDIENSDDKKILSCGNSITSEESVLNASNIEQCLMQIEKSLVNIEQNLLHVHDLEIPQLNNFLCKQLTDDKNHSGNIHNVCNSINNSDRPSSNMSLGFESLFISDEKLSRSDNDINIEDNLNFNEHSSTIQLINDSSSIEVFGNCVESDFKKSDLSQQTKIDVMNYNLNVENCHESKKLSQRRKNSLDDKSNLSIHKKRKTSLNNYFSKNNIPIINSRKTLSQDALEKYSKESLQTRKKRRELSRRSINTHSSECLSNYVNTKPEEFVKKVKTVCDEVPRASRIEFEAPLSQRNIGKKPMHRGEDNVIEKKISTDNHKQTSVDSKTHLSQYSDNAIIPSKLLSLSFSLLLAALLQAVRCLADLVEDTFRSVTIDKYALHD